MANFNHFDLTLDTIAPSGSITANRYYKEQGTVTIDKGDASFMKVWPDTDTTGTKGTGYAAAEWVAAATSAETAFPKDGNYYYHLVLMDDLGNESEVYNTTITTYDTQIPTVLSVTLNGGAAKTNSRTGNTCVFTYEDPLKSGSTDGNSGVVSATITGTDMVDSPVTLTLDTSGSYTYTFAFTAAAVDGDKTISVVVKDAAGNESAAVSSVIKLDTTAATAVLTLHEVGYTAEVPTGALPAYVNYRNFAAVIDIENVHTDVAAYKIWGDVVDHTSEPTEWTTVTTGSDPIIVDNLQFTASDGTKNVYIRTKDDAGNIWPAETSVEDFPEAAKESRVYDGSAPSVSIELATTVTGYFSNVTGYTDVTVTPTVDASVAGVSTWELMVNDVAKKSGTTEIPASWTLTSADGFTANASNSIKLKVTDKAGNSTTSEAKTVYLDTNYSSMKCSTIFEEWYTTTFDIQLTGTDSGAGIKLVKVWGNSTSDDTTVPSGATAVNWTGSPQTVSKDSINWNLAQSDKNYIHIYYVDNVGNEKVIHAGQEVATDGGTATGTATAFGYDTVNPVINSFAFDRLAYATTSATLNISASDDTSKVYQMKVWGDISDAATEGAAGWETYSATRSVTLTGTDGTKTAYVKVRDKAMLESTASSCTCELDRTKPSANITLHPSADETQSQPAYTNIRTFVAHIWGADDQGQPAQDNLRYVLVGDYNTTEAAAKVPTAIKFVNYAINTAYAVGDLIYNSAAPTDTDATKYVKVKTAITAEENTSWSAIVDKLESPWQAVQFVSGQTYMRIPVATSDFLYATNPDGLKTITVMIADNAGNVATASASFTYDTTAAEVTVSDRDYDRISKVHTLRRTTDGEVSGKYNDYVNFKFKADSIYVAHKVCAYTAMNGKTAQENATLGSHEDAAIPTAGGSLNMNVAVEEIQAQTKVDCLITGLDLENAIKAVAPAFSTETSYIVGDVVKYSDTVYTCKVAHAAGDWNAEHFVANVDGTKIVTVYVQDQGGTWSEAAKFTV